MRLNLRSLVIGVQSSMVVIPINTLLVQLFSRTSRRPASRQYPVYSLGRGDVDSEELSTSTSNARTGSDSVDREGQSESEDGEDGSEEEGKKAGDGRGRMSEEGREEGGGVGSETGTACRDNKSRASTDTGASVDLNISALPEKHDTASTSVINTSTSAEEIYNSQALKLNLKKTKIPEEVTMTKTDNLPHLPGEELSVVDPYNTNNSANECGSTPPYHCRSAGAKETPSARRTEHFNYIQETRWFQNAVQYMRRNISRMVLARTQRKTRPAMNEDAQQSKNHDSSRLPDAQVGGHAFKPGSYLDRLKAKTNMEGKTQVQTDRPATATYLHSGSGDRNTYETVTYFDKLKIRKKKRKQVKAKGGPEDELAKRDTCRVTARPSDGPRSKTCWFCCTIPGHKHTARQIRKLKGKSSNGSSSASDSQTVKQTLRTKINNLKRELTPQNKLQPGDDEETIPFPAIRDFHDYEYEQAMRKGSRALKHFRRQAAQCRAEDLVNTNRNALSHDVDGRSDSVDDTPRSKADVVVDVDAHTDSSEEEVEKNGCVTCLEATGSRFWATVMCVFCCRCPEG